jgi:hypothetical protein
MLLPLDGPAVYKTASVTDTPQEVKVGASALEERKVVTMQPIDGAIYYGYDNSVSSTSGTKIFKGQFIHLEASEKLPVWIVAEAGQTVDVRITEVS